MGGKSINSTIKINKRHKVGVINRINGGSLTQYITVKGWVAKFKHELVRMATDA